MYMKNNCNAARRGSFWNIQEEYRTLEKDGAEAAQGGPDRAHTCPGRGGPTLSAPGLRRSVLHRLRVFIYAVVQGRFDPRAAVHPMGLYKQGQTPWGRAI